MSDHDDLAENLRALGVRAVDAAAEVLRERFGASDLRVTTKGSLADVVTDADLASERVVREVLLAERPSDGMLAEEGTSIEGTSGVSWVLDPIDSTANFARGIPIWSISLAAMDERGVFAGVVAFPPGNEVISGTSASGVLLNGSRVPPGPPPPLPGSMVAIGWGPRSSGRRQGRVAESLIHRVGKVRSPGSPALGLAWTALGRFDAAYYEMDFNDWDVAAGAFLCECAGLTVRREEADAEDSSHRLLAARSELVESLAPLVFG
jgi:fructose-1,6-bisphosphatase/inositol monophosphatase family enzyme